MPIHHRHHSPPQSENGGPQTSPSSPRPPPQQRRRIKTTTESNTRKLLCIFFKCIIMGFVLSLFLLFIGFAAVILLHFLLTTTANRRRHHRRHHQQFPPQTDPDNQIVSYSREHLQEFLPHLIYSASSIQSSKDCVICLEGFNEGDNCRKLPDCRHLFHVNCVDNWLIKVPNCPICRTRVRLGSGSMNRDDEWKVWWPMAFEDGNVSV